MDVNLVRKEMLEAAALLIAELDKEVPNRVVILQLSDTLAERTIALDGWLSKGGFLPSEWERCK